MELVHGTMRLRTERPIRRAKIVCALVFSLAVGICAYAATYQVLLALASTGTR
jgi:hypothetical protein